jgi:fibronectin type 3 domain-containing protein
VSSNAAGSPASIALSGTGVTAVQHSVLLDWTPSASPAATGYNVYRSSGSGYTRLNSSPLAALTYTDSAVQNLQTYSYVVTAVDASGNESPYSNLVQMNIP